MLFRAFAMVIKIYPAYKLHMYGKSNEPNQNEQIKNLIKDHKLENDVTLHGYRTGTTWLKSYRRLTSLYSQDLQAYRQHMAFLPNWESILLLANL